MRKMFKPPKGVLRYRERTEEQEFGAGEKDYRLCSVCHAVYFNKSWHHASVVHIAAVKKLETLWVTTCPACKMIRNHQYEGMVVIDAIPKKYQNELFHMIKAYGERAYKKDCQHRVIAVNKEENKKWTVTTTENQLAAKLAKKIKEVFDKAKVRTAYSQQPDDVERVFVNFKPYWSFMPGRG